MPIFGLYGGEPAEFGNFELRLAPWLDDNWAFHDNRDGEWKWRHGDRMISLWHLEHGQRLDWDTLIIMQWDMLALAPVQHIFKPLYRDEIYLPGLRPLDEIESRFYWTRPDTEVYEDYVQFKAWLKQHYGYDGLLHACQFFTAALPRSFLDRYAVMPNPELGFLEHKLPACAMLFGTPLRDFPHLQVGWFGAAPTGQRLTLTAVKQDIPAATIAAEMLTPRGARLFHPVSAHFPASQSGLGLWLTLEAGAGLLRRVARLLSPQTIKWGAEFMNLFRPPSPAFPAARRKCDMVIVFAASDGEWLGVEDLLDSCSTYLTCDYEVVVADDATEDDTLERLLKAGCWVVRNPERQYLWGLNLTLQRAFREAHRLFESPIYLKIDPDALIIGPGLEDALSSAFRANPEQGLLGTYHTDWNGEQRDLSYWRERMLRVSKDLGKPYRLAIQNGYQVGDGVQGGAYALSRACLDSITERGWFFGADGYRPSGVRGRHVAEDSLIAMLTYAAGYKVGEIGGPGQPFGIWDVGLPMSPEELVHQNRIVTHAMKYRDEVSLAARDFFRARRNEVRLAMKPHQTSF
jgi:hypothetical protein